MTPLTAISAVSPASLAALPDAVRPEMVGNALPMRLPAGGFADLLTQGTAAMDAKVAHAEDMVARFALDDNVPVHQVTIALEEARLAIEFAMQIRTRMVEGYREIMNMQL